MHTYRSGTIVKGVYLWPLLTLAVVANAGAVWENRPDSLYGSAIGWVAFWTRYMDGTVVVLGCLEGHAF